jgi:hypothetical protein
MDFDFDGGRLQVEAWRKRLQAAGADPDLIYNYVGLTFRELESVVSSYERATREAEQLIDASLNKTDE